MVASRHWSGTKDSTRHIAMKLNRNSNAGPLAKVAHITLGEKPSGPAEED
jgi:hypothetical protein